MYLCYCYFFYFIFYRNKRESDIWKKQTRLTFNETAHLLWLRNRNNDVRQKRVRHLSAAVIGPDFINVRRCWFWFPSSFPRACPRKVPDLLYIPFKIFVRKIETWIEKSSGRWASLRNPAEVFGVVYSEARHQRAAFPALSSISR